MNVANPIGVLDDDPTAADVHAPLNVLLDRVVEAIRRYLVLPGLEYSEHVSAGAPFDP